MTASEWADRLSPKLADSPNFSSYHGQLEMPHVAVGCI